MVEVYELSFGLPNPPTRVWISADALKTFNKYQKREQPTKSFIKKLKRYSERGFWNFQGDSKSKRPIRPEWDDILRIGEISSLFRLYGFYEDGSKSNFIIIDAFLKHDTALSEAERKRINEVAKVKRDRTWEKIER